MYIARSKSGHFEIVKSLGAIDPKEDMQGAGAADQLQTVQGLSEAELVADYRHRRRHLDDTLRRRRPFVQMPLGQAMLEHPEVVEKPE